LTARTPQTATETPDIYKTKGWVIHVHVRNLLWQLLCLLVEILHFLLSKSFRRLGLLFHQH
jgi:hypothetical protein